MKKCKQKRFYVTEISTRDFSYVSEILRRDLRKILKNHDFLKSRTLHEKHKNQ